MFEWLKFPEILQHLFRLNEHYWTSPDLDKLDKAALHSLVSNHQTLANYYKYLRTVIANAQDKQDKALKIKQYKAALFLAELLDEIYQRHWTNHHAISGLRAQQAIMRQKLNEAGFLVLTPFQIAIPPPAWSLALFVMENHPKANAIRLIIARLRRTMSVLEKIPDVLAGYKNFIRAADPWASLVFTHLGWIAFIPRLAASLWLLFLHSVPGWWMGEEEKKIYWVKRFLMHLQTNWPAFLNDFNWFITGLICAFVLSGTLAAVYLTLAMFYVDIFIAGLKSAQTLIDLHIQKEQCNPKHMSDFLQAQAMEPYIRAIDEHIAYESKRAALSIGNATALFLAMCLTLPGMIAISPLLVAVVCAATVVAISIVVFILGNILDHYAPSVNIPPVPEPESGITTLGLFAHTADEPDCKFKSLSLPFGTSN